MGHQGRVHERGTADDGRVDPGKEDLHRVGRFSPANLDLDSALLSGRCDTALDQFVSAEADRGGIEIGPT